MRTDARAQSASFDDVDVAPEKISQVGNKAAGKPGRHVGSLSGPASPRDRAEYTNADHAVFRSDAQDLFAFAAEDFLDSHARILRTH